MESQTISTQAFGQPAFFYYNPEPTPEHGQYGHFSQHPCAGHSDAQAQTYYQQSYSPNFRTIGQQHTMYPQLPATTPPLHQKPILISPKPNQQKPGLLTESEHPPLALNTECSTLDLYGYPSTPPLSVSGSPSNSPPSVCDILPTPTTGSYMGSGVIEGVKEGCEGDVKNEILAGGDIFRPCSPPLTPGTCRTLL